MDDPSWKCGHEAQDNFGNLTFWRCSDPNDIVIMAASAMSLFDACSIGGSENNNSDFKFDSTALFCVSQHFQKLDAAEREHTRNTNEWFLILCSSIVFFMQAGFAMVCAGCVRKKNLQNTMLKNILDATFSSLIYCAIGYPFAFGGQNTTEGLTFVGNAGFFGLGEEIQFSFWSMQLAFSATCVTIVAGTVAERLQMNAYMLYTVFLSGFVYPCAAHSLWSSNGFLSSSAAKPFGGIGAIDFAGAGVVHLLGGTTALCASYVLGPRVGRFYDSHGRAFRKAKNLPGHSVALQMLGTMILWFGWFGFNTGSALLLGLEHSGAIAARVAANTSIAGACGTIGAVFLNLYVQYELTGDIRFDIHMAMNGALAGLVSITSSCGTVELWAAALIGMVSGALYLGGHHLMIYLRIDDVVDGIPVHMFGGLWGMIATGLFSTSRGMLTAYGSDEHIGWFYEWGRRSLNATLLRNQIIACCYIMGWAIFLMLPFFIFLQSKGMLRLENLNQLVGLDHSYHGAVLQEAENEVLRDVQEFERVDRKLKSSKSGTGSKDRMEPVGCVVEITNDSGVGEEDDDLNDQSFGI